MPNSLLSAYAVATDLLEPLLVPWLWLRTRRGKEDPLRLRERFGFASRARPEGLLLWIHAASVGEANSVLLLIQLLRERLPKLSILVTTGTVTSAELLASRLPEGAFHHYAPLDTPQITARFMRHWKPEAAFFVESELWPNLIQAADRYNCFLAVLNGRMSERSFRSWNKKPGMIRTLMRCFNIVFAGSEDDAARYRQLGAKRVEYHGNLKYDAPILPCDEAQLAALQRDIGARPLWLAASTHPGEEEQIVQAHQLLAATRPDLLTIIVPRHPARGSEVAEIVSKTGGASRRAQKQAISSSTSFYIADTMGELGLFYRLSEIVLMGGSLVAHGGQNPLEPARLSCALVSGAHVHNFKDAYAGLSAAGACQMIASGKELAAAIDTLLRDPGKRSAAGKKAKHFVDERAGSAEMLYTRLAPVFGLLAS